MLYDIFFSLFLPCSCCLHRAKLLKSRSWQICFKMVLKHVVRCVFKWNQKSRWKRGWSRVDEEQKKASNTLFAFRKVPNKYRDLSGQGEKCTSLNLYPAKVESHSSAGSNAGTKGEKKTHPNLISIKRNKFVPIWIRCVFSCTLLPSNSLCVYMPTNE